MTSTADSPRHQSERTGAWRRRAADLRELCAISAPAEQVDRLREAFVLLDASELPPQLPAAGMLGAVDFATLMRHGGYLSAAASLLGDRASYMLSRGPGGRSMASVVHDGQASEETSEGETPALALVGAQLAGLLAMLDGARATEARVRSVAAARLN